MMRNIIVLFILYGISFNLFSQEIFQREKRDDQWITGDYGSGNYDYFGATFIGFSSDSLELFYKPNPIAFDLTNASICDTAGQYLFHTNGISIANHAGEVMEGGERINPGSIGDDWADLGLPIDQGALILPLPESDSLYYVFHETLDYTADNPEGRSTITRQLYYSVIDMSENNGLGEVIEKDIELISDSLDYGKITACRHANGRDWWLLFHQYDSNLYYEVLLDPQGARIYNEIIVGDTLPTSNGQNIFAPNGSTFINISAFKLNENYISIYSFDRSSGELYNPLTIPRFLNRDIVGGGGAISVNSRFLYNSEYDSLFQYDLEAEDIEASMELVAIRDVDFTSPPFDIPVNFFLQQLAPDHKIYISSFNQTTYYSVIHNPNLKGMACNAKNHDLELLTYNYRNIPNFPYYGLGPLDGSPADTLGIDNPPPTARYEYVQDSSDIYEVAFYNGTLFPPEACMYEVPYDAYIWDFGDGTSSHERHPVHVFPEDGIYEVCLTAYNHTGSDVYCANIQVGVVATEEPPSPLSNARLFPNPADDVLYFDYFLEGNTRAQAGIYDMHGRLIRQRPLKNGNVSQGWDVSGLQRGVYFFVVEAEGRVVFREKVVIF